MQFEEPFQGQAGLNGSSTVDLLPTKLAQGFDFRSMPASTHKVSEPRCFNA